MSAEEIDDMDADERAAWAITFSEFDGGGSFNFGTGEWRKPGSGE